MQPVIVDTNVLVAGVLTAEPASPTVQILDAMLNGSLVFVLSPALLAEYQAVLRRPKIAALHGLTQSEVEQLLAELTANALWREPTEERSAPDPGDDHLWTLLAEEPQAILITGDQLLLAQPPPASTVLAPKQFWQLHQHNPSH